MILFDAQNLFGSGPARLHVGGLALRHDAGDLPLADGVELVVQGRAGRTITQTGTLLSDEARAMAGLIDAIEDRLDGVARSLVEHDGRAWDKVVMLRFEPGPMTAVGARYRVDYTVDYLQVKP
ncbi:MAG: hypothetical protein AAGG38_04245 [Planctomycetota bacterium]